MYFKFANTLTSCGACLVALALFIAPAEGESNVRSFEVTGVEIEDPLFEELFSDRPTPGVFLHYCNKYDGRKNDRGANSVEQHQFAAKRFGGRYVLAEQLDQAAEYGIIVYGHRDEPEYAKRGLRTRGEVVNVPRRVAAVSVPGVDLPEIHHGAGWIMDPRFLKEFSRQIEQRGRNNEHD